MKKEEKTGNTKLKSFIDEIARDSLALGSIPMFIIVAARSTVGSHYTFLYQILLAGLILFILSFFLKSQNHLARSILLYIFTILFYNDLKFTLFASFLLILILGSVAYLKYPKKQIIFGIINGLISSGISYYIVKILT